MQLQDQSAQLCASAVVFKNPSVKVETQAEQSVSVTKPPTIVPHAPPANAGSAINHIRLQQNQIASK